MLNRAASLNWLGRDHGDRRRRRVRGRHKRGRRQEIGIGNAALTVESPEIAGVGAGAPDRQGADEQADALLGLLGGRLRWRT